MGVAAECEEADRLNHLKGNDPPTSWDADVMVGVPLEESD